MSLELRVIAYAIASERLRVPLHSNGLRVDLVHTTAHVRPAKHVRAPIELENGRRVRVKVDGSPGVVLDGYDDGAIVREDDGDETWFDAEDLEVDYCSEPCS